MKDMHEFRFETPLLPPDPKQGLKQGQINVC